MIKHDNNLSINFSLDEENDIMELLDNISSSYSANVSCSFENDIEIDPNVYTETQISKRKFLRNIIPRHVKKLSSEFCSNLFSNYKTCEGYKSLFSKDKENISIKDSNFNTNYTNFLKSPSRGSISDIQSAELKYNLNVKPIVIKKFTEEVNVSQESDKFLEAKKTSKRLTQDSKRIEAVNNPIKRLKSAIGTKPKDTFPKIDPAKDTLLNCSLTIEPNAKMNKVDQSLPLIDTRSKWF